MEGEHVEIKKYTSIHLPVFISFIILLFLARHAHGIYSIVSIGHTIFLLCPSRVTAGSDYLELSVIQRCLASLKFSAVWEVVGGQIYSSFQ